MPGTHTIRPFEAHSTERGSDGVSRSGVGNQRLTEEISKQVEKIVKHLEKIVNHPEKIDYYLEKID